MPDALPRNRRTGAFERRVARVLDRLVDGSTSLIVACSGGPDSTAALLATARWASTREVALTAACFDHRLRPRNETETDRAFVERVASRLGVAFASGTAGRRAARSARGPEDAARRARYRWLAQVCRGAGASQCVVGHTLNDQAETILLRLTRGAGLSGARGMAGRADWPVPGGRGLSVVRPLLEIPREDVEGYLAALGLEARLDPSNESLDYDRNVIRQRVLPELRALNPRADDALARFARHAGADDAALEAWAKREAERLVRYDGRGADRRAELDRRGLVALPTAVAARVVRWACAGVGIAPDAVQVESLLQAAQRRGSQVALAGGRAATVGDTLLIRAVRFST